MRIIGTPDSIIGKHDMAIWLTPPFEFGVTQDSVLMVSLTPSFPQITSLEAASPAVTGMAAYESN